MNIFLTGATGYIGSAIADVLKKAGHSVTGLARSDEAAGKLHLMGVTSHRGDLSSPASLAAAASALDGVIHTGTTNDGRLDQAAIRTMLDALHGSGKPFVYTSGVWVLGNTGDTPADETARLNPAKLVAWRPAVERMVLESAQKGVRAIVIRPALVYGRGGGIPADLVKSARENGAARYVGTGQNRWPVIDVDDLADLYLRAVEGAAPGTLLNAADSSAYRVKEIAEAASDGAGKDGRTESWPLEEARKILGAYADALVLDQLVSSAKAKSMLGWKPRAAGILDDLHRGSYVS
ncbi:MAG TPA: NAD-dependent epimerase/dehydratase family protein [Bryobacteraceae bacterium]|jgi:nucleoside-diphosphate-sugar epimerase|nr:NAD-dependent epimerase/dehydratase family protein [Bryobacteraceae bacterium]